MTSDTILKFQMYFILIFKNLNMKNLDENSKEIETEFLNFPLPLCRLMISGTTENYPIKFCTSQVLDKIYYNKSVSFKISGNHHC